MVWCFPIRYFFSVLLWAIPGVFPLHFHRRVLVILFLCYLSIWLFNYFLSVPIFYSKIVLLPLHPIVGMSTWILNFLVSRIFFRYFGMSNFVYIARPCHGIFQVFLLSPISFDSSFRVALSNLSAVLFLSSYPNIFPSFFYSLEFLLVVAISLSVLLA